LKQILFESSLYSLQKLGGQKPAKSQQNNARAKAKWPLLWHYLADYEKAFAGWEQLLTLSFS